MKNFAVSFSLVFVLLILSGSILLAAEKEKKESKKKVEPVKYQAPIGSFLAMEQKAFDACSSFMTGLPETKASRYYPKNYRDLELTDQQKAEIYGIANEYRKTVDQLRARQKRINEEYATALASVLTDSQLKKLEADKLASKKKEKKGTDEIKKPTRRRGADESAKNN